MEALDAEVDSTRLQNGPDSPVQGLPDPSSRTEGLGGIDAVLADDGEPADVRATLGNIASGLAEQLSSITDEMNKIRQELYGESGIGGIAKELEKLKSGALGGVLNDGSFDDVLGSASGSSSTRDRLTERPSSSSRGSCYGNDLSDREGKVGRDEARRRCTSREHEMELNDLRRKLSERKSNSAPVSAKPSVTILEKMMLVAIILTVFYVGSPFFRMAVKRSINSLVSGEFIDDAGQNVDESEW